MYRLIIAEKPSVSQTIAYSIGANERVKDGKYSYYEGITLDKIKEEDLDVLATDALNDACYPGNPREATKEQVIEMFRMLMA